MGFSLEKRLNGLSSFLTILLSFAFAWVLGKFLAGFWEVPKVSEMPILQTLAQTQAVSGRDSYLFGQSQVSQTVVETPIASSSPVSDMQVTKLKLKLIGLIDLGSRGVAIIENGAKTVVVLQGEAVLAGVTLVDVLQNGVVIDNRGKRERLLLDETDLDVATVGEASKAPASNLVGRLSLAEQQKLDGIGHQLRKSPMSITKYIRFQPLNENGRWVGVKIWSKSDAALYKSIGFEEGDVLKEVNSHTIQDMVNDPKLWRAFLSMDQFDLVVERNGTPQMISVNFRD